MLPGFRGEEVIPLYPPQLVRIYTEDSKVMADTDLGTVSLKIPVCTSWPSWPTDPSVSCDISKLGTHQF